MDLTNIYVLHSSHLDLYWIGAQADCLTLGSKIIDDALRMAEEDPSFHFMIETARFLEYYAANYPERMDALKAAFTRGQFEMSASYTDRLENHVDGESLVRNILYGKKVINEILGIDCKLSCHPDLPGFAEQTPQIYKKSGIKYYVSARGFKYGARFNWQGLDGSSIIMYNVPGHYAYYDVDQIIAEFGETKKKINSDFILLGCSAGDMGPAGTFMVKSGEKMKRVNLKEYLNELNEIHTDCHFETVNTFEVLERMQPDNLETYKGEYPSRWGHHGSATNVLFYRLDKEASRKLMDAEKLSTVCKMLGVEPDIHFVKHPLKDPNDNGGVRRYFDLKITPETISGWISYAWRLHVTTHDHNFGGVEGAQTEFDRIIYQKAAIKIADEITCKSLKAISGKLGIADGHYAVCNTMNWERNELVYLPNAALEKDTDYVVTDSDGNKSGIFKTSQGWVFNAENIPSFGIKTYSIDEGSCGKQYRNAKIYSENSVITVINNFYKIEICCTTGCILKIIDIETNHVWCGGGNFLSVTAFSDPSLGGSERIVDKPVLDNSHVLSVCVKEVNPLFSEIEVVTEVLDVKVYQSILIFNDKKQINMKVRFNWPGLPDMQLKMNLGARSEQSEIYYGVPYGVQKHGDYLETESLRFGNDEISYELFNRYREGQGHYNIVEEDDY